MFALPFFLQRTPLPFTFMAVGPPPSSSPSSAAAAAPLHAQLIKNGATNPSLYNNLITQYSLPSALHLFHNLPFRPTVVSWTSIISSTSSSSPLISLRLFVSMLRHPTLPNQRTLATVLRTCATTSPHLLPLVHQLHSLSLKLALCSLPFTGSALVSGYGKCGKAEDAIKVFDRIQQRDEVCYSSAIVGLARCKNPIHALRLFVGMRSEGIGSSTYGLSGALRAAAELAALEQSRLIHAHAIVAGLDCDVVVGTAMIGAYGKSGAFVDAQNVFDGLSTVANTVTWNVMLAVYGQQGDWESTLDMFERMHDRGIVCDKYTFFAILTACSNAGLVVEARRWLELMGLKYGILPGLQHYTCLIGAVARVGHLEEAEGIALSMPFEPDDAVWRTLLSACVVHGNVNMARSVGRRLLEMDPHDESTYLMLVNVHSAAGKRDEVRKLRKNMKDRDLRGEGGRSWIEVRGKVHVFMADDKRHKRKDEIYAKVVELIEGIEKLGYKGPEDNRLWYHSEKLAVAFGLLTGAVPKGKVLRVVKSLRTCSDCHEAFKYVSRMLEREIVVRDVNRYHRFEYGKCSCRDIW